MPLPFIRAAIVWSLLLLGAAPFSVTAAETDTARAGADFFENKIRPVLSHRCFKCHGLEKQEGKLRLDRGDRCSPADARAA